MLRIVWFVEKIGFGTQKGFQKKLSIGRYHAKQISQPVSWKISQKSPKILKFSKFSIFQMFSIFFESTLPA